MSTRHQPEQADPIVQAPPARDERARRFRRAMKLAGALVGIVGLLLGLRMAAAIWLASAARAALAEKLGAPVSVRSVALRLPSTVTLDDVRSDRVSAARVTIRLDFWRLVRGEKRIEHALAEEVTASGGAAAFAELRRRPTGWLLTALQARIDAPASGAAALAALDLDEAMRPREVSVYGGRLYAIRDIEANAIREGGRWRVWLQSPAARGSIGWNPGAKAAEIDLDLDDAPLAGPPFAVLDLSRARATGRLHIERDPEHLAAEGELRLRGVALIHPALASHPLVDLDGSIAGHVHVLGDGRVIESDDLVFRRGTAVLEVSGRYERGGRSQVALDLPRTGCDAVYAALAPLLPTLDGLALRGEIEGRVRIDAGSQKLDDLVLEHQLDVACVAERDPLRADPRPLDGPVLARIDGAPRWIGPDSESFTPLGRIPPSTVRAFLAAEDARFFDHHGFDPWTIRRALAANLAAHAFEKGASTITQQLARNLFLDGERTISRKLEEAVIAWRLEQALPKRRLLELYLNLVELGPGIHGLGEGARVLLAKNVAALSLDDATRLAALAPAPRRGFDAAWSRRYRDLAYKLAGGEGLHQLAALRAGARSTSATPPPVLPLMTFP